MNDLPRASRFYSYLPKEILHAFEHVPVRVFPAAPDGAESEPYLYKNFCALVKVTLASFLDPSIGSGQATAPAVLEGAVFSDICDAHRSLHDMWRE
jgi:hypothetical protein